MNEVFASAVRIQTLSGRMIDLSEPEPQDMDPTDIAHALSMQVRWNGHVRRWWSVADHSLYVLRLVEQYLAAHPGEMGPKQWVNPNFAARCYHAEVKLAALLHDSAEAYTGDLASPIKREMPSFCTLETCVERALLVRFQLPFLASDPIVKAADHAALVVEARELTARPDLIESSPDDRVAEMVRYGIALEYSSPTETKGVFLGRLAQALRARDDALGLAC